MGRLVMAETITMFIPFAMALVNLESSVAGFAVSLGLSASVGLVLQANGRKRETELSMREVASRSGFGSVATFNRAFREKNGCTPSKYRAIYGGR